MRLGKRLRSLGGQKVRARADPARLDDLALASDDLMVILRDYIRPIFQHHTARNAHSGASAADAWHHDVDAEPAWQSEEPIARWAPLGSTHVLAWVAGQCAYAPAAVWDEAWPLLLPPMMTLLGAPQPSAKVHGACVAQRLLSSAPAPLLQRTGVRAMVEEALVELFHFRTDADDGPALLCATIHAQLSLLSHVTSDVQYDVLSRLVSQGVLATLAYCAPASASVPALRDASGRTAALGSARQQQVLAGMALACADMLLTRLGEASLRFWNAYMDWACAWLEHAWSATSQFPPRGAPLRDITSMVDEIVDQGTLTHAPSPSACAWDDAAKDLVDSVHACVHVTTKWIDQASGAEPGRAPLPEEVPGARAWATRLLTAACRCWCQLDALDIQNTSLSARCAAVSLDLQALCTACLDAAPWLGTEVRDALTQAVPAIVALAPARFAWLEDAARDRKS